MNVMQQIQECAISERATRSLKIQPDVIVNSCGRRRVPVIRLSGLWLDRLGFKPEQRITVILKDRELIIRPEEDDQQPGMSGAGRT